MPNALGLSFDECVSRFSGVDSIDDPQAFCGSLEQALSGGKALTLQLDQVKALCPPCAERMESIGVKKMHVGGKAGVPSELRKAIDRLGGAFHVELPIVKTDEEAGTFTGWASVVTREDGTPIIDAHGDIIPIGDLEKAAQAAFLRQTGSGRVGDMHFFVGVADLVESMVITSDKREALGFGPGPEGWAVTFRTDDPALKKEISSGFKRELSISGRAERVPLEGTREDIALLRGLELSTVELFSIVDRGAAGDEDNRPAIVLAKREQKGEGMKPDAKKSKTVLQRLRDLFGMHSTVMKDRALGMQIEALNEAAEWDLNDLAGASGVDAEALAGIITGDLEPSAEQLSAIAGAFGMEAADLMPPADEETLEETEEEVESQDGEEEVENQEEDETVESGEVENQEEDETTMTDKRHANLVKENSDLRDRIAKLEQKDELNKAMDIAKSLEALPGASTEELAKVFMITKSIPSTERETLMKVLTASAKMIAEGELLKERGTKFRGTAPEGSAFAEFHQKVDDHVKTHGTTSAAAKIAVSKSNPELYNRMKQEAN